MKKTPDVNTVGLQWADLLDHWVLVTTEGLEKTSISLLQKKHKHLYQPISYSSPSDQSTRVPQTKLCLIIRCVEFKLTRNTPESKEGAPINLS